MRAGPAMWMVGLPLTLQSATVLVPPAILCAVLGSHASLAGRCGRGLRLLRIVAGFAAPVLMVPWVLHLARWDFRGGTVLCYRVAMLLAVAGCVVTLVRTLGRTTDGRGMDLAALILLLASVGLVFLPGLVFWWTPLHLEALLAALCRTAVDWGAALLLAVGLVDTVNRGGSGPSGSAS